jgi:prevent-host-death family protein
MEMGITEAKARLTELVRRAEAGEEVVLTRNGRAVVRLTVVPASRRKTPEELMAVIRQIQDEVSAKGLAWPHMTSNHDFLYDEDGLPV